MASFVKLFKQTFRRKGVKEETIKNKTITESETVCEKEFDDNETKGKFETENYKNTTTLSPSSTDFLKDKISHKDREFDTFVFGDQNDQLQMADVISESDETMRKYGAVPKKKDKKLKPAKSTPRNVWDDPKTFYKPNIPEKNQQKKRKMSEPLEFEGSTDSSDGKIMDFTCQSPSVLYGSRTSGYESDCESITSLSTHKVERKKTCDGTEPPRNSNISHSYSVPNLRYNESKTTHYHIKHIENFQNSSSTGQGHSSNTINTISSTESRDMATRVEEQTKASSDIHNQVNRKVQTEIYIGAEEYLERPDKKKFVILKGSNCGCKFAAKMLFAKHCTENPETKAYVLDNATEWSVVDLKSRSVVLIHDISGTASFDRSRFDEFARLLEQNLLPFAKKNGKLTVIATMRDFSTEDTQLVTDKYHDYIIHAKNKRYRPSVETKQLLVQSFMEQFNVRACPSENIHRNDHDKMSLISEETMNGSVPLLGNVGYIRILNEFFSWGLHDGINFFRKPTRGLVAQIRHFAENDPISFIALLAVYVHEGGLGRAGLDQMNEMNALSISSKFWFSIENGLNTSPKGKLKKNEKRKSKGEINKQCNDRQMLFRYAHKHEVMPNIADIIHREARKLDGSFLDESREIYRFGSERIKNSFLVVCCEYYPEALQTCDPVFFYEFIKPYSQSSSEDDNEYFFIDRESDEKRCQAFMIRLKEEMLSGNVAQCMRHSVMSTDFFRDFIKFFGERSHFMKFLSDKKHWKWLVIKATDYKENMSSIVYGIEHEENDENITDFILEEGMWREKRQKDKWHEFTQAQEKKTIVKAAEKAKTKTFVKLIEMGVSTPDEAVIKAIDSSSLDIIEVILQRGKPCRKLKCKALLHALEVYTDLKGRKETDAALNIFKKISSEVSINYKEDGVVSLIHFASGRKNSQMLKILLEGERLFGDSIDTDLVSTTGETALMVATKNELPENVKLLLKYGANQKLKENTETLPIFIACKEGMLGIVKILRDANPYIVKEKDILGNYPLVVAVRHGQQEIVQYLLKGGEDYLEMKDTSGQSALHIASKEGNLFLVDKLIGAGFGPTDTDNQMETPLSLACQFKRHTTARRLLKACICDNYIDNRILMRAIKANDRELVMLLLEFGYDISSGDTVHGIPLFVAIQSKIYDMLNFLLEKGANPNISQDGSTPILIAGKECDIKAIKILRQYKADLLANQEVTGETILHIVVSKKCLEVVKKLFTFPECKIILDSKNKKGETALHIASRHGYVEIVKCLLKAGALPTIYSRFGQPKDLVKLQKKEISVKDTELWNSYCDIEKILENWKSYADKDNM